MGLLHEAVSIYVLAERPVTLVSRAGVSARLRLDHLYRTFFELIAAQIATSIANARAYEEERRRAEARNLVHRRQHAANTARRADGCSRSFFTLSKRKGLPHL
jgi:hypothetical protein